ncbi:MAG: hypothetical protein AAB874_08210 [Patescibacteria group bacterium]
MFDIRPYLVIPKLIIQPTWGGNYIAQVKGWDRGELATNKIGQSYELCSGSNLSLITSSKNPQFLAEITNSKAVELPTSPPNSIPLVRLIETDPNSVLGNEIVTQFGPTMPLLIKFTQALGNSFQLHVPDGTKHPKWKPKPESWYYFEPGMVTLGVKSGVNWEEYQKSVTELDEYICALSQQVLSGSKTLADAKNEINKLIVKYNPRQFVNFAYPNAGDLIDLSPCGIHHSWEEDTDKYPLGNVLYELQVNVMDDVATIRSFDKGKMNKDGSVRPLQIEDYFAFIDRSPKANNPKTHFQKSQHITEKLSYSKERLMKTKYYALDKVVITGYKSAYHERIDRFKHVFIKSGEIEVTAGNVSITVSKGHSVFIPKMALEYSIKNNSKDSVILISY